MSNTDSSALNHTTETTLIVDCGNHTDGILIPNYPMLDSNAVIPSTKTYSHALPCAIEFKASNSVTRIKLLVLDEVMQHIEQLGESVKTILQASVVNEKQRKALEDIVNDYIHKSIAQLFEM